MADVANVRHHVSQLVRHLVQLEIRAARTNKQVQNNQLSSGVKSAAYSYEQKVTGKDFQKDESDS